MNCAQDTDCFTIGDVLAHLRQTELLLSLATVGLPRIQREKPRIMAREIRPLEPDDIPELSRFLVEGFHTPPDADFAAPDVLRWKYFEPRGDRDAPRSLVVREAGRIVCHTGMLHGWFHVAAEPGRRITTLHGIDWLSTSTQRNTGAFVMMRGHSYADTHYALSYSEAARRVIEAAGYQCVSTIPVLRKVLRPTYHLRGEAGVRTRGIARAARDAARALVHRGRSPSVAVSLRPVNVFGQEVELVLAACTLDVVYTSRGPGWLNHALLYPRSRVTGWLVEYEKRVRGFALLNVVRRDEARIGKIVDCFLDTDTPALWHAAIAALTAELRSQHADVADCLGSTPWMVQALRASGYHPAHQINFLLHDPAGLLPPNPMMHISPFESDYGYL
jgi:hypothetical protein